MVFCVLLFLYLLDCKIIGWMCEIFAEAKLYFKFIWEKGVSLHRNSAKTYLVMDSTKVRLIRSP